MPRACVRRVRAAGAALPAPDAHQHGLEGRPFGNFQSVVQVLDLLERQLDRRLRDALPVHRPLQALLRQGWLGLGQGVGRGRGAQVLGRSGLWGAGPLRLQHPQEKRAVLPDVDEQVVA